jgi:hypothetical protein
MPKVVQDSRISFEILLETIQKKLLKRMSMNIRLYIKALPLAVGKTPRDVRESQTPGGFCSLLFLVLLLRILGTHSQSLIILMHRPWDGANIESCLRDAEHISIQSNGYHSLDQRVHRHTYWDVKGTYFARLLGLLQ